MNEIDRPGWDQVEAGYQRIVDAAAGTDAEANAQQILADARAKVDGIVADTQRRVESAERTWAGIRTGKLNVVMKPQTPSEIRAAAHADIAELTKAAVDDLSGLLA